MVHAKGTWVTQAANTGCKTAPQTAKCGATMTEYMHCFGWLSVFIYLLWAEGRPNRVHRTAGCGRL